MDYIMLRLCLYASDIYWQLKITIFLLLAQIWIQIFNVSVLLQFHKLTEKIMTGKTVAGYLHILVESLEIEGATEPIHAHITLGEIAKMDTEPKKSGEIINQVFLSQVSKEQPRFILRCMEGEKILGECRYDIHPFMERDGGTNTLNSDLFGEENKKIGHAKLKLTFYSTKNGTLKVRIFGLEFHPEFVQQFKEAKIRVTCGIHAQSTPVRPLKEKFDEEVQVKILKTSASLIFELIHERGTLASYTVKNIKDAGYLSEQPKAYQVSLFNNGKAIGVISYKIDWIK